MAPQVAWIGLGNMGRVSRSLKSLKRLRNEDIIDAFHFEGDVQEPRRERRTR